MATSTSTAFASPPIPPGNPWTLFNAGTSPVTVDELYSSGSFTILPGATALINAEDVMRSRTLTTAIANMNLVIVKFGGLIDLGRVAPITYYAFANPPNPPSAPLYTPYTLTTSGSSITANSSPMTVGIFTHLLFLINILSLTGTLSVGWEEFDGQAYYPVQTLISDLTQPGLYTFPAGEYGLAGRVTTTLTSSTGGVAPSATFAIIVQGRP